MRLDSSEGRETSESRNRTQDGSSETAGRCFPIFCASAVRWEFYLGSCALRWAVDRDPSPFLSSVSRYSFSAVNLKRRCLKGMSTLELTRASAQHPRDPIRERLHFQSFRPGALRKWEDDLMDKWIWVDLGGVFRSIWAER